MNQDYLKQEKFETRICCPLCQRELVMNWQKDNIPYFGEIMHISARCQCSFRFADTMILSSKEPMRYEMPVETLEDLNARVIRSTSGTIRIPEMGVAIEPGSVSESYITNIEGVLHRVRDVLMTASKWVQEDEEKFSRSQELLCMLEEVIEGKKKITVIVEDPLGNSAIISKKAKAIKLSKEEAEKLNTGMIVFDVDKTELVHDVSDNVQPLGEN
ncbi:MAG: ZPR1 zinc finger domain-containing protein [Methanosarcina sp.]|nr:ZPR1 zinc finger domain-containing protein [Methanosarcina sp.]MDD3316102.1 ZPR1 zinc finger domain-containing protein [Methanosarcina sp.]MDD4305834.1 ZPR1 zinc finger domain-containing protein [Methanosarcina sp.]MDD4619724.1 ZPR1 zinc finger domain-containing protein [Methanosarcina sp.]NLN43816.1 ZPR1 zinc finger domain-containing protein [Methanosarcina sp.]